MRIVIVNCSTMRDHALHVSDPRDRHPLCTAFLGGEAFYRLLKPTGLDFTSQFRPYPYRFDEYAAAAYRFLVLIDNFLRP